MSQDRHGIAGAGNWIIDHLFICDRWPREETLSNILDEDRGTGGAPYNCLLDIARFGPPDGGKPIPLEAVGLTGDDADGEYIRNDCAAHHIDAAALRKIDQAPTSYTNVMVVQATGRRTFFHNRGANALFGPEHVPVETIRARLVHVGYLLLLDRMDEPDEEFGTVAARLLARFQEAGIETSIDAVSEDSDRFPKIVRPALKHTDYAILNELEAGRTTGHDLKPAGRPDPKAIRASAQDLLDLGVRRLVCIHMPEGGYVRTKDGQEVWQPSLQLPDGYIKGAAGAGDAFCAGMLYGIHERWDLDRSLRLAVSAAAKSLSRPGCTEACTNLADTLALADQFGYQKAVM
ncbi:MAG: carbohydrate kinase family protein [Planctomycetes bacterium]|nr:carbohydrate kinase family protein [Planctomycetota bacterium]